MIFFFLIWSLTSLGFFALAASMSKHQKQMFGHELDTSKTKQMSVLGWLILAIALIICLCAGAASDMISYWIGCLTFAAIVVALTLSYAEKKTKLISLVCAVVAVLSALICLF